MKATAKKVLVCINRRYTLGQPSCAARGSEQLAHAIEKEITRRHLNLQVECVLCLGFCDRGPNLRLMPGGPFLHHISQDDFQETMKFIEAFARTDNTQGV